MLYLEKMKMHTITSGNYVTSVHGMVHPNRIIGEHDFLYILDGTWEIWEDDTSYALQSDDLLILTAGRHHYGKKLCNPGNRHMYVHALPTDVEKKYNHLYPSAVDPSEAFRLFSCSSHARKASIYWAAGVMTERGAPVILAYCSSPSFRFSLDCI